MIDPWTNLLQPAIVTSLFGFRAHYSEHIASAATVNSTSKYSLLALFLLVCIVTSSAGSASVESQDTAELQTSAHFYIQLKPYTGALKISTQTSLQTLLNESREFQSITTPYINFGAVEDKRLWLKSSLINVGEKDGTWRLDINRQYYLELDVYTVRANGLVHQVMQHTRHSNFADRAVQDRMLGVDLELKSGERIDIFASVRSNTATYVPWAIGSIEGVLLNHRQENVTNWILNGSLLTFIVFSLMITFVVGWRISLSFSLYILAGLVYVLHTDGYLFATLWPNNMAWNDPLNLTFMLMMPVAGLTFSRALFNFKRNAPRFDKFVLAVMILAAITALSSFYVFEVRALKILAYLLTPLGSITQFAAASIAVKQNLLGAKAYFVGALIILLSMNYAIIAHAFPGYFNLDNTLDFGHIALITESLAFAGAITLRLVGLRDERDRALASELKLTQSRLELSSKLQKAQEDFSDARRMADVRRAQLDSVGHDIQQPLNSLRHAISNISDKNEEATQQMLDAFDYLENLAKSQVTSEAAKSATERGRTPISSEVFPVSSVLDNIHTMYKAEATANDIQLIYRPNNTAISAEPVSLMRAVGNLISNAIKHSQATKLLLVARRRGDKLLIEVWDNGIGFNSGSAAPDSRDTDNLGIKEKGPAINNQTGHGLGLSIVRSFAVDANFEFILDSRTGKGTLARITVPLAD